MWKEGTEISLHLTVKCRFQCTNFLKKSLFLNSIKHQFTCTGQEIGKVGHKIHLYPYVKYDSLSRFSVNSCLLYNLLPRTHIYNFMKTYRCY